mmetsp:Transcript_20317/g.57212  ORF Transcript_20317/g.57212 Transcript_20317/m.57212 type:complete len:299 (+) Transcript_20317:418-1314(+)
MFTLASCATASPPDSFSALTSSLYCADSPPYWFRTAVTRVSAFTSSLESSIQWPALHSRRPPLSGKVRRTCPSDPVRPLIVTDSSGSFPSALATRVSTWSLYSAGVAAGSASVYPMVPDMACSSQLPFSQSSPTRWSCALGHSHSTTGSNDSVRDCDAPVRVRRNGQGPSIVPAAAGGHEAMRALSAKSENMAKKPRCNALWSSPTDAPSSPSRKPSSPKPDEHSQLMVTQSGSTTPMSARRSRSRPRCRSSTSSSPSGPSDLANTARRGASTPLPTTKYTATRPSGASCLTLEKSSS